MKTYWDTSALVAALHDAAIRERLDTGEHVTRSHSLSELFSVLTGGRLGFRYSPEKAALLVGDIAGQLAFTDLTANEVLSGLGQARRHGVAGGRVHDWMHALAAEKAGAAKLLTLNETDFSGLERGFEVAVP
jgi:predicted nucleic acid-binding protein